MYPAAEPAVCATFVSRIESRRLISAKNEKLSTAAMIDAPNVHPILSPMYMLVQEITLPTRHPASTARHVSCGSLLAAPRPDMGAFSEGTSSACGDRYGDASAMRIFSA